MMKRCKNTSKEKEVNQKNCFQVPWNHVLLLCALSILPYVSSLHGDFVFDDAESVVNNPIVNGKDSITEIVSRDFWGRPILSSTSHKSFRPVTTFTFWLNWRLHGASTFGFHLVNVVLHSIASLLVYFCTREWKACLALPAAAVFAVHPIHTEAVSNITGRAELLCAVFFLGALLIYQRNITKIGGAICETTIFTLLAVLSFSSKEQGITVLPFVAFLCMFSRPPDWRRTVSYLLTITMILICVRVHINGYTTPQFTEFDNPAAFVHTPVLRLVNYAYLWLYNIGLLILPTNLCFDYSMRCIPPITSWFDPRSLSLPAILILPYPVMVMVKNIPREYQRISLVSIALGGLTFLPASNLLVTVGFTIAERVLYIPSVGFSILIAVAYRTMQKRGINSDLLVMILFGLAVAQCHKRSFEWSSELRLYSSGLQVCPTNAKIHYNLAKVLGDNGLRSEAEKNYWEAIRLNPTYEHALNNLGNLLEQEGRRKEAEHLLRKAVAVRPNFATAWMNLGITLMHNNNLQESLKSFKNSLDIRPLSADCLFNLGNLYQKMGRPSDARDSWLNSTSIDPSHVQSWTNLLVVLDELDSCDTMVALSSRAMHWGSRHAAIRSQLGSCLAQLGHFELAEIHLLAASQLNPHLALYHTNLGVLYHRWHRFDAAETAYRRALAIDSSSSHLRNSLEVVRRLQRNGTTLH